MAASTSKGVITLIFLALVLDLLAFTFVPPSSRALVRS